VKAHLRVTPRGDLLQLGLRWPRALIASRMRIAASTPESFGCRLVTNRAAVDMNRTGAALEIDRCQSLARISRSPRSNFSLRCNLLLAAAFRIGRFVSAE
jgi:hypothetical protein